MILQFYGGGSWQNRALLLPRLVSDPYSQTTLLLALGNKKTRLDSNAKYTSNINTNYINTKTKWSDPYPQKMSGRHPFTSHSQNQNYLRIFKKFFAPVAQEEMWLWRLFLTKHKNMSQIFVSKRSQLVLYLLCFHIYYIWMWYKAGFGGWRFLSSFIFSFPPLSLFHNTALPAAIIF